MSRPHDEPDGATPGGDRGLDGAGTSPGELDGTTPGGDRGLDGAGPSPGERAGTSPGVDLARIDASVIGRVQGVGFRWFVLEEARRLDLRGWVANEQDGSVMCVAEGPRGDVEALVAALERGPAGARVDRVMPRWGRAGGGLGRFEIRAGAHRGD